MQFQLQDIDIFQRRRVLCDVTMRNLIFAALLDSDSESFAVWGATLTVDPPHSVSSTKEQYATAYGKTCHRTGVVIWKLSVVRRGGHICIGVAFDDRDRNTYLWNGNSGFGFGSVSFF